MARLTIYTKSYCPYCIRALSMLKSAGIDDYEEISIDGNEGVMRQKLVELTNGRYDVPQIFIDGQYIGDDDQLAVLVQSGEIKDMLAKEISG